MNNQHLDDIRLALVTAFSPTECTIQNESDRHRHHRGVSSDGNTPTHIHIRIVSPLFSDQSLLKRHRAIHTVLAPFSYLHAIRIDAVSPGDPY